MYLSFFGLNEKPFAITPDQIPQFALALADEVVE